MHQTDLGTWTFLWVIVAIALLIRQWRAHDNVGLFLTYIIGFGAIHWLAAAIYLLPWYSTWGEDFVAEGLREATIATIALAVGAEAASWLMRWQRPNAPRPQTVGMTIADPLAINVYLATGLVLYGVVSPLAGRLPSIQALVATGSMVAVVALCLKSWNGWHRGQSTTMWRWLAVSTLMPVVTVVTQGFLGYGFSAMLTVFAFVGSIYRPRWKVVAAGVLLAYLGLSVYVTYMRDRGEIRKVVWGGGGLADRATQLSDTFAEMEWFDVYDVDHLRRIDSRLNQDYLVGAAMSHLSRGLSRFADGETFVDAAVSVIPRALWPDKPMSAGSGDLVATYTGFRFADGTSVGIGQVMECYINFGTTGVAVGFVVIGAVLAFVDRRAFHALKQGDVRRFTLWYLPSLSLLQVGGSLVEVTSSAAAAWLMAVMINYVISQLHQRAPVPVPAQVSLSVPSEPEVLS
jgi:hypothetical protein